MWEGGGVGGGRRDSPFFGGHFFLELNFCFSISHETLIVLEKVIIKTHLSDYLYVLPEITLLPDPRNYNSPILQT